MTHLQPGGSAAPTARIRILGCDPPPPPQQGVNWAVVAACVAAAALGIAVAVTGRHLLAGPTAPPQAAPAISGLGVQALVGAQPPRHRPVVRRALRAAVAPADLRAAARTERRTAVRQVGSTAVSAGRPAGTTPAAPPPPATVPAGDPAPAGDPVPAADTASIPAPAAPAAPAAPPLRDTVTRPDLPPDPTDPNTTIDQP